MASTALVIGGTGPTGPHIVAGLEHRGFEVVVLHTGRHEIDEVAHLEHIHADVRSGDAVGEALGDRRFDVAVVTYGRLRELAPTLVGRTGQFVSVGGAPAYRGYFDADRWDPPGLPVPTAEDAPTSGEAEDGKSYRIRRTEEYLFDHHPQATHFRYPYVYGPRQMVPREWYFVRRMLDGRHRILIPDGGLTLATFGYVENLAHAVLLAVDQPDAAAGRIFNAGDVEALTLLQVGQLCAAELGFPTLGPGASSDTKPAADTIEFVSVPFELAPPTHPVVFQNRTTHRLLDLSRLRTTLGYTDVVPARDAVRRTVRWLVENPPDPGGIEEQVLEDPFNYRDEDLLLDAWDSARAALEVVPYTSRPGFGLHFGGPGATRPRPDTRI